VKKTTETDLVRAILAWLQIAKPQGVWWRANTGCFAGEYKGKKRFVRFGVPGMSDIQGVHDGLAVFIECKGEKGKLSAAQENFGKEIIAANGCYIVARSIEDVEKAL
jgi:hypothetical protein